MPRSTEQIEKIRAGKKKLIMDAALELFANNGFHATSISQITQKAGISKGLVYNYFQSKDEILSEITEWAFNNIYSNFDFNKDGSLTDEEFTGFIRSSLRSTLENVQFWKLYYALVVQPAILEKYTQKYAGEGQNITQMLYQYIQQHGSSNPERDLFSISALLKGTTLMLVNAPDFFHLEDIEENTIQACLLLIRN